MELRKIHRGGERKASYILTLPHDLLKDLSIAEGDYVSLTVEDGRIVIAPGKNAKGGGPIGLLPKDNPPASQTRRESMTIKYESEQSGVRSETEG